MKIILPTPELREPRQSTEPMTIQARGVPTRYSVAKKGVMSFMWACFCNGDLETIKKYNEWEKE